MGRIAWFDAHARKIYGDLETFDEAILAPLQRDLIKCERALAMLLPCLGRCMGRVLAMLIFRKRNCWHASLVCKLACACYLTRGRAIGTWLRIPCFVTAPAHPRHTIHLGEGQIC